MSPVARLFLTLLFSSGLVCLALAEDKSTAGEIYDMMFAKNDKPISYRDRTLSYVFDLCGIPDYVLFQEYAVNNHYAENGYWPEGVFHTLISSASNDHFAVPEGVDPVSTDGPQHVSSSKPGSRFGPLVLGISSAIIGLSTFAIYYAVKNFAFGVDYRRGVDRIPIDAHVIIDSGACSNDSCPTNSPANKLWKTQNFTLQTQQFPISPKPSDSDNLRSKCSLHTDDDADLRPTGSAELLIKRLRTSLVSLSKKSPTSCKREKVKVIRKPPAHTCLGKDSRKSSESSVESGPITPNDQSAKAKKAAGKKSGSKSSRKSSTDNKPDMRRADTLPARSHTHGNKDQSRLSANRTRAKSLGSASSDEEKPPCPLCSHSDLSEDNGGTSPITKSILSAKRTQSSTHSYQIEKTTGPGEVNRSTLQRANSILDADRFPPTDSDQSDEALPPGSLPDAQKRIQNIVVHRSDSNHSSGVKTIRIVRNKEHERNEMSDDVPLLLALQSLDDDMKGTVQIISPVPSGSTHSNMVQLVPKTNRVVDKSSDGSFGDEPDLDDFYIKERPSTGSDLPKKRSLTGEIVEVSPVRGKSAKSSSRKR